jgi:hypothetical protein
LDAMLCNSIGTISKFRGRLGGSVLMRLEAELSCGETGYSAGKHCKTQHDLADRMEKYGIHMEVTSTSSESAPEYS